MIKLHVDAEILAGIGPLVQVWIVELLLVVRGVVTSLKGGGRSGASPVVLTIL